MTTKRDFWLGLLALGAAAMALVAPASAQSTLNGRVLGASAPIANAVVTLWTASAGAPAQLAQTQTDADGRFALSAPGAQDATCIWSPKAVRRKPPRTKAPTMPSC